MKRGFTLIELSIVLVIIGLVVGGILFGRELVKVAEVRAVAKEVQQLNLAMTTFRVKYNAVAGDMTNYSQFFGTSCDAYITGIDTPAGPNGNGRIDNHDEGYIAMCELQQAKVISAALAPWMGAVNVNSVIHSHVWNNYPLLPVNGTYGDNLSGYRMGTGTFPANMPPQPWSWTTWREVPVNTTFMMDTKFDDGIPNTGNVMSRSYVGGFCTNGTAYWPIDGTAYLNTESGVEDCIVNYMAKF